MKIQLLRWREFQHYKHRSPPWIRLYRKLLDDREYRRMSGDAKALLVDLWMLASETADGLLDVTFSDLAWRLRMQEAGMVLALQEIALTVDQNGAAKWFTWNASDLPASCGQRAAPEAEESRDRGRDREEAEDARADVREKLPEEYREDFDAMARSCHRPESFRLEVATLVAGRHPRAEGSTPEDVGRGIRELALSGKGHGSLAGYVGTVTKRRREAERDTRARVETVANERRKREQRTTTVAGSGTPTKLDLTGTLAKLGIVPDKGAA